MQKKDILKQNGNDYNYSDFSRFITNEKECFYTILFPDFNFKNMII
jgi:hypothetical protein